jgi:hypothetical protein
MPDFRFWGVLVALTAGTFPAIANEPTRMKLPYQAEQVEPFGRFMRAASPQYPSEALQRGQTAVIEITATSNGNKMLTSASYRLDTPESAIFLKPLQEAVAQWLFNPRRDKDCLPLMQPVVARVSFEIEKGSPQVFIIHAPEADSVLNGSRTYPDHMKPLFRPPAILYPKRMLAWRREAYVYGVVDIDPAGDVTHATATVFLLPGPVQPPEADETSRFAADFEVNARHHLMRFRFPAAPPEWTGPRVRCMEFSYRLTR